MRIILCCRDGDGTISFEEFQNLNNRFPMILYPAFKLQDAIQTSTLGSSEWVKIASRLVRIRRLRQEAILGGRDPALVTLPEEGCFNALKRLFTCAACRSKRVVHPTSKDPEAAPATAEEALAAFDHGKQEAGMCYSGDVLCGYAHVVYVCHRNETASRSHQTYSTTTRKCRIWRYELRWCPPACHCVYCLHVDHKDTSHDLDIERVNIALY